jgi:DDE superfamily endonuclease
MGRKLGTDEFVISADEKTSIQARSRKHPPVPPMPGVPMKVEHEYKRMGAWSYLAALDVHRAKVFGRCENSSTIVAFDRLVAQVMRRRPYRDARRVFWIVDNGTAHRGRAAVDRLQKQHPNLVLVHAPVHASWLNQIEIYFSIIQRKVLTPNDFSSLDVLSQRLLAFEHHYQTIAKPFEWRFTRRDLAVLLRELGRHLAAAA